MLALASGPASDPPLSWLQRLWAPSQRCSSLLLFLQLLRQHTTYTHTVPYFYRRPRCLSLLHALSVSNVSRLPRFQPTGSTSCFIANPEISETTGPHSGPATALTGKPSIFSYHVPSFFSTDISGGSNGKLQAQGTTKPVSPPRPSWPHLPPTSAPPKSQKVPMFQCSSAGDWTDPARTCLVAAW